MAVTEVKHPDDFDYRMTTDHRGRSTYAMRWIVDTDDALMPAPLVATGAQSIVSGFTNPLPARWSTYSHQGSTDIFAYLKGNLNLYKPFPHDKPTRWFVDGTYEPLDPGQEEEAGDTNPLSRPVVYRLESEPYSRIVTVDKDGNPINNAANQEFTEPPEEEGFRDVLVATKNVANLTAITNLNNTYRYSVNSGTFYGAGALHAKIDTIESSELLTEGNISYYQAIIRVVFRHEPWDLKVLNQGFMVVDPLFTDIVRAKDEDGNPTPEPVLLDATGKMLTGGGVGNYRTFRVRREVDYTNLGI